MKLANNTSGNIGYNLEYIVGVEEDGDDSGGGGGEEGEGVAAMALFDYPLLPCLPFSAKWKCLFLIVVQNKYLSFSQLFLVIKSLSKQENLVT